MISMGTMIEQIDGLRDTDSLTEWEQDFVTSVVEKFLLAKKSTQGFTGKQVEIVERIWRKHFA